jgi:NitT/TauT family transport system ATP-binding protein
MDATVVPADDSLADAMPELIEAQNIQFSYPQHRQENLPILVDFSLAIRKGECFCLLGPSGSGKTTVLRMIAGFQFPDSGRLTLEGRDITGPGVDRGVVFQGDDSLFSWLDSTDNVAFGLRMRGTERAARRQTARDFLRLVGLVGQDRKYPSELSGGMKQRIQIARVLANDPKVLLMDEPFGALDAQTRAELQDEVVRIWMKTGKTILFITHDIGEAILLGDRIGVMHSGPGSKIREIISVDIPRPRNRATVEFGRLYEHINRLIVEEVKLARTSANVDH